jgi:hypothetical protein
MLFVSSGQQGLPTCGARYADEGWKSVIVVPKIDIILAPLVVYQEEIKRTPSIYRLVIVAVRLDLIRRCWYLEIFPRSW